MSITSFAVPSDKFEPADKSAGGFSFPCSACRSENRHAGDEPCRGCGHNVNSSIKPKTGAHILMRSMTFDDMADLLSALADEMSVEIPSKPDNVEFFKIRMVGVTTVNCRRSCILREWQESHHKLMGA